MENTVNSQNGQIMGFTLAISLSSLEWWENNSDAGLIQDSNGRVVRTCPAWAAADISGGHYMAVQHPLFINIVLACGACR